MSTTKDTTIIDEAIKEFMSRMVNAGYELDEEGNQWMVDNLQDVFYPLSEQGSEQSAPSQANNEEIRDLLQKLVEQTPATPQSASPDKKMGLSGWNMFLRHMKETEPNEKHTFQSCSPLWKKMSAEEKEVFNQQAKEYNAKTPATPASSGTPGKAKKPNPWNQFCKDFKVECDKKGVKYDVKKASEAYNKLKAQQ